MDNDLLKQLELLKKFEETLVKQAEFQKDLYAELMATQFVLEMVTETLMSASPNSREAIAKYLKNGLDTGTVTDPRTRSMLEHYHKIATDESHKTPEGRRSRLKLVPAPGAEEEPPTKDE